MSEMKIVKKTLCFIEFENNSEKGEMYYTVVDDEYDNFDYCLVMGKKLIEKVKRYDYRILSFKRKQDVYLVEELREIISD